MALPQIMAAITGAALAIIAPVKKKMEEIPIEEEESEEFVELPNGQEFTNGGTGGVVPANAEMPGLPAPSAQASYYPEYYTTDEYVDIPMPVPTPPAVPTPGGAMPRPGIMGVTDFQLRPSLGKIKPVETKPKRKMLVPVKKTVQKPKIIPPVLARSAEQAATIARIRSMGPKAIAQDLFAKAEKAKNKFEKNRFLKAAWLKMMRSTNNTSERVKYWKELYAIDANYAKNIWPGAYEKYIRKSAPKPKSKPKTVVPKTPSGPRSNSFSAKASGKGTFSFVAGERKFG